MSAGGAMITFVRFGLEINPDFLNAKVFAGYSQYIDTKLFKVIDNNPGEELALLLLLTGLFMLAFSKEKEETEAVVKLRYKAMTQSFAAGFVFLAGVVLFTYGLAFMYMLILNVLVPLGSFTILFQIHLYRNRRNQKQYSA
jgi:uncharacterized membrane protein YfcA